MFNKISVTLASATLLAIPLGLAIGEDTLPFTDLRIEGTLLPDSLDVDATANSSLGSVSQSGESDFEDAWRVGVVAHAARTSNNGGITFGSGGGIHYSRWYDDEGVEEKVEAIAATVRFGLVIRPASMFHIEVMPYGSVGAARGEINGEESDTAFYWEFGGIAGAFLTVNGFQVGIHGGYLWNGTDLEFDNNDGNFPTPVTDVETELRGDGAFIGASIGGRF
jgi:hypothetical protein